MPQHILQPSFSGGEFTPSLHSRIDLAKYSIGLKTCRNMIVHPQGGASNRPGTKFVAEVLDSTKETRIVPFEFSLTQSYTLEFGEGYVRFYTLHGQIQRTAANQQTYDPDTTYKRNDFVNVGNYATLAIGGGKTLYVNAPYGYDTTGLSIDLETNSGDTLAVLYSGIGITIQLADTTAAENVVTAIELAIQNAHTDLVNFRVTSTAAYDAAPPVTGTVASQNFAGEGTYFNATTTYGLEYSGRANNIFPPVTAAWNNTQVIYQVATPYSESDLEDLKFTQSADVLYITHPEHAPMTLTRYNHDDWEFEEFAYVDGPFMPQNITTTTMTYSGSPDKITSSTPYFTSNMIGGLLKLIHEVGGSKVQEDLTADTGAGSESTAIVVGRTWRLVTHGAWDAKITIQQRETTADSWVEIRSFSSKIDSGGYSDFNVNTFGTLNGPNLVRVICSDYNSGTCSIDLTSDPWTQEDIFEITSLTSSTVANVSARRHSNTAATEDWAEGSWSDKNGFPKCSTFFQDRLCFASTVAEPQGIWASQTGDYVNFGKSSPLVDSDTIGVNLPSRKMNDINNLINLSSLLALTAATEWSVGPGQSGVFTPTSLEVKCEGYRGSANVDPVIVSNRSIFVQPMGTVVCNLGYDFGSNSYQSQAISLFSQHLLQGYSIVGMAYQQEPNSIIWLVRSDGQLLGLTYLPEQEVLAWHRHDTDGLVESICSIPGDGYNEIWLIVKRGSKRFVEYMVNRDASTDPKDQFFMDCGISYDTPTVVSGITKASQAVVTTATNHGYANGDLVDFQDILGMTELNGHRYVVSDKSANTFKIKDINSGEYINSTTYTTYVSGGEVRKAATTISGLTHLEGETVSILADGNVIAPQVVSSGAITLSIAASKVHVGLGFTSDFETLNIEQGLQDGTFQDRRKKISQVTLRFLNSRGGFIGPDEDSLTEIINRDENNYDDPIALFTGDVREVLNSNYDYNGRLFYRQTDPLPVTILAAIPVVTAGA